MLLPLGGHWGSEAKGQRGFPGNLSGHRKKPVTVHHSAFWDPLKLLLYPAEWKDTKQTKPPLRGQEEGKSFWGSFSPRPLKCKQLTALEPCAEKPREAAQRRKKAVYGSHSSTVQTGAKPGLADVPPGQLQRFILRLPPLDLLSPFSSRFSAAYTWLAISNSGFSITP